MCCVVLNPVDTFLNRKVKGGVRKIAVAELGLGAGERSPIRYFDFRFQWSPVPEDALGPTILVKVPESTRALGLVLTLGVTKCPVRTFHTPTHQILA